MVNTKKTSKLILIVLIVSILGLMLALSGEARHNKIKANKPVRAAWQPPQQSGCTDTDGGTNIFTKGTARSARETRTDACSKFSSNRILEYWCRGNNVEGYYTDCPSGYQCAYGACVGAPTSPTGTLSLSSIPDGASIYIDNDNKNYGYTPNTIKLPLGTHFFILTKFNYQPTDKQFFTFSYAGEAINRTVTLVPTSAGNATNTTPIIGNNTTPIIGNNTTPIIGNASNTTTPEPFPGNFS